MECALSVYVDFLMRLSTWLMGPSNSVYTALVSTYITTHRRTLTHISPAAPPPRCPGYQYVNDMQMTGSQLGDQRAMTLQNYISGALISSHRLSALRYLSMCICMSAILFPHPTEGVLSIEDCTVALYLSPCPNCIRYILQSYKTSDGSLEWLLSFTKMDR